MESTDNQTLPRRVAFIMFTDIVGYSKMMSKDEAATLAFLKEHNDLLNAKINATGGRVIKTIGDAFMAEFPAAQAALEAAISIQEELHARNSGRIESAKQRIRIGIHSGEVEVQGDDLFGDAVNIAARLEPLCPAGGIHLSVSALEDTRLSPTWKIIKAGNQKLKNIDRKIPTVYVKTASMDPRCDVRPRKGIPLWALSLGIIAFAGLTWAAMPFVERAAERARWKEINHIDFRKTAVSDWQRAKNDWDMQTDFSASTTLDAAHFLDAHVWLREGLQRQSAKIEIDVIATSNNLPQITLYMADSLTQAGSADALGSVKKTISWRGNGLQVDWKTNAKFRTASLGESVDNGAFVSHWSKKNYLRDTKQVQRLAFVLDGGYLTFIENDKNLGTTLTRELGSAGSKQMWVGFQARNVDVVSAKVYVKRKKTEIGLEEAAGAYRQEGNFELAAKVYDDLIQRSENDKDRCRFLYKKAGVLRAWGHEAEFQATLEKIAGFEPNEYTGYALYDLGYFQQQQASKGVAAASDRAEAAFRDLLLKQPQHQEANRARFARVKNMIEHGDNHALAMELATPILADPGSIYFADTATLLAQGSRELAGDARFSLLKEQITRSKEFPDARIALSLVALSEYAKAQDWTGYLDLAYELINEPLLSKTDLDNVARVIQAREADMTRIETEGAPLSATAKPARSKKRLSKSQLARLAEEQALAAKRLAELKEANKKEADKIMSFMVRVETNRELAIRFYRSYLRPGGLSPGARRAEAFLLKSIVVHGDDNKTQTKSKPLPLTGTFAVGDPLPAAPVMMPGERLKLKYDSGTSWGCGISIPILGKDPDDFRGFKGIAFEIKARAGLKIQFVLHETGAGAPDLAEYIGQRDADGESYTSTHEFQGNGDWQRFTFDFKSVKPSLWWGNQTGNQMFDIQSLQSLSVQILQSQGSGLLELRDLSIVPVLDNSATEDKKKPVKLGPLAAASERFEYLLNTACRIESFPEVKDGIHVTTIGTNQVKVKYDSGNDWGGSVNIFPRSDVTKSDAKLTQLDLSGYDHFSFEINAPAGFKFTTYIVEFGAKGTKESYPEKPEGPDGESYSYEFETVGTGTWKSYTIDLTELNHYAYWGNQKGSKRLDLHGIGEVVFGFGGKQGKGEFELKNLTFFRSATKGAANTKEAPGALASQMNEYRFFKKGRNYLQLEPEVKGGLKTFVSPPDTIRAVYDSGLDWGGDLIINAPGKEEPRTIDLRGFTKARFKIMAPKGFAYKFTLHELGANKPGLVYPKDSPRSDCEVYAYEFDLVGNGDWQDKEIDLAEMAQFKYWGNQTGNKKLDLESISEVVIGFNGGQGKGEFTIKDIYFVK